MPIFTRDDKSVLFIHIPKNGGTSVSRFAEENGWRVDLEIRGRKRTDLGFFRSTPQHLHADVLRSFLNTASFDLAIAIIRNPMDRMISEYQWQTRQGETELEPGRWVEQAFAAYAKDPFVFDNHLRPQVEFISDIPGLKTFRFEEAGVQAAQQLVADISPSPAVEQDGPKRLASLRRILMGAPEKVVAHKQADQDRKRDLQREFACMKSEIQDFYRADYEAFSYE